VNQKPMKIIKEEFHEQIKVAAVPSFHTKSLTSRHEARNVSDKIYPLLLSKIQYVILAMEFSEGLEVDCFFCVPQNYKT
jgi:hypothetical protein